MTQFAYRVVKVEDSGMDWSQKLQRQIDEQAEAGWRLAHTYLHDGYTVALIFERKREPQMR